MDLGVFGLDLEDQTRRTLLETKGKYNIQFSIECMPSFLKSAMNDEFDDGSVDLASSKLYFVILFAIDGWESPIWRINGPLVMV